jgi:dihydrofolate reductase
MGKVTAELSMSLDGFVAGLDDNPGHVFDWYENGEVAFPLPGTDMVYHISQVSANYLREAWGNLGAMVAGRRMFNVAHAWGGQPPGGENCFILTHHPPREWIKPGSPFVFVTDGIASAIRQAQAVAGDKEVSVSSPSVVQQAIKAGLLDELLIDLAPVLLGDGISLFGHLGVDAIQFEQMGVVQGKGVTHLKYRVVK